MQEVTYCFRAADPDAVIRVYDSPEGENTICKWCIEDLPRASEVPSIKSELDEFMRHKKEVEDETGKSLSLDEIEKKNKEKMARLEDEMKRMRGKPEPPID